MKKLAGMFYGRVETYAAALEAKDGEALAAALSRNIYPKAEDAPGMRGLADWMIVAETALAGISEDEISRGHAVLPLPGSLPREE